MGDVSTLLELLSGGADVALMAIAFAIYKLERRVFKLETLLSIRDIENAK